MKRAAIGIRTHSGWGALVVVAGDAPNFEVVDRRLIVTAAAQKPGAKQPYHYAAELGPQESERHIQKCSADSKQLASAAIRDVVNTLRERHYDVVGSAILLASGRALPPLPQILAAHSLIHAAEGEFFRHVVREACAELGSGVAGIRERELEARAKTAFGKDAKRVLLRISNMGKLLGPPWTQDQKTAALAAAILLAKGTRTKAPPLKRRQGRGTQNSEA